MGFPTYVPLGRDVSEANFSFGTANTVLSLFFHIGRRCMQQTLPLIQMVLPFLPKELGKYKHMSDGVSATQHPGSET